MSKKIKLKHPIKYGQDEIFELELRKPKAGDLRKLPAEVKNLGQILDFAAQLAGQPPSVIDELELVDAMHLFEVIMDFLPSALKTGSKQ